MKNKKEGLEPFEGKLVEHWEQMSSLWGITPSAGRVAGLLFAMPQGRTQEEIAEQLKISQGNASMALRELITWGVVRRLRISGERRERYEIEGDIWRLFLAVLKERRRREFETTLLILDECITILEQSGTKNLKVKDRIEKARNFYRTVDQIAERILSGGENLLYHSESSHD